MRDDSWPGWFWVSGWLAGIAVEQHLTRVLRPRGEQQHALPALRKPERPGVHDPVGPGVAELTQAAGEVAHGVAAIGAFTAFIIQGVGAVNKYTRLNENTDGFSEIGVEAPSFKRSEMVRSGDGQIGDYELITQEGGRATLSSLLHGRLRDPFPRGFVSSCEEDLLPGAVITQQPAI